MAEMGENMKEKALSFLREQRVIVMSTVSPDGEPQSATVNFMVDDNFNIYFATRKSSRKFKNIEANPRISIVAGFDTDKPSSLQMQGTAEVLTNGRINKTIELGESIITHQHNWWPLLRVTGLDFVIVRVEVTWARWLRFHVDSKSGKYTEDYNQIIPDTATPKN